MACQLFVDLGAAENGSNLPAMERNSRDETAAIALDSATYQVSCWQMMAFDENWKVHT
jgi:hypothetical protein